MLDDVVIGQTVQDESAEGLEEAMAENDWENASKKLGEGKVIDLFIHYLDKKGYNLGILGVIRKLLKHE